MRILKTTVNLSAAIIISTALIACSNSETAPDDKMSAAMERLDSLEQNDMAFSLKTMKSVQALAEAQMRVFNETARITKDHPELRDTIIDGFENLEIKMP